jgi:hypothetical protein
VHVQEVRHLVGWGRKSVTSGKKQACGIEAFWCEICFIGYKILACGIEAFWCEICYIGYKTLLPARCARATW